MYKFFYKNENGRLVCRTLDLQILIESMFDAAESDDDIDWIQEQLEQVVEMSAETAEEYL